jgi:hypothetical protein
LATVGYFLIARRTAALTDKDTILLADFVNTGGDSVFDGTLKQGLALQLGQSPFLNLFSDTSVRSSSAENRDSIRIEEPPVDRL